jgi:hypothetical protein
VPRLLLDGILASRLAHTNFLNPRTPIRAHQSAHTIQQQQAGFQDLLANLNFCCLKNMYCAPSLGRPAADPAAAAAFFR